MTAAALLLMFILPLLSLAAVCVYGPLADRVKDRRRGCRQARHRRTGQAQWPYLPRATARLSQPGWHIEQWTPAGWAQLVPAKAA